jgi:hypothetical protein
LVGRAGSLTLQQIVKGIIPSLIFGVRLEQEKLQRKLLLKKVEGRFMF